MITRSKRCDAFTNLHHNASAFMTQNSGKQSLGIIARQSECVGMANARCFDFDEHLTFSRSINFYRFNAEWLTGFDGYSGTTFYHDLPQEIAKNFDL